MSQSFDRLISVLNTRAGVAIGVSLVFAAMLPLGYTEDIVVLWRAVAFPELVCPPCP